MFVQYSNDNIQQHASEKCNRTLSGKGVRPGKGNVDLSRRSDKSRGRSRWALVDGCLRHG